MHWQYIYNDGVSVTKKWPHLLQRERLLPPRAERRRREARRETFITPELVTARQSILGPPAEGRPGPSISKILVKLNNTNLTYISICPSIWECSNIWFDIWGWKDGAVWVVMVSKRCQLGALFSFLLRRTLRGSYNLVKYWLWEIFYYFYCCSSSYWRGIYPSYLHFAFHI